MTIILRPWTHNDLDRLVSLADNERIARNMMDSFPHPYTTGNGMAFIDMALSHTPPVILAIAIDGAVTGAIGLHPQPDIQRMNAELGYWLGEPYWGQGIMTGAIRQMVDYGFQHLDITRIFARPFGTNIASQRALEKAGFRLEGRLEKTFFKNGLFMD